jgi:cyclopropane fatty-acyl-phospholipid synthase-like methyltransferase
MSRTEWEDFFNGHAPVYNDNVFTKNTIAEVDFLIEVLGISPGQSILDVGCGTGRHSVELARRGYTVTGLDLSSGMLEEAKKAADAAGVEVTWIQSNAAEFSIEDPVDTVICLCEGAFGLLGSDDSPIGQPAAILSNVQRSMKPGAKCLFTVLNGYALVRKHSQEDVEKNTFDPLSLTEISEISPSEGSPAASLRERGFVPTELHLLFALAGLEILNIWGGTAGNWGKRAIDLDEIEIMVLGQKPSE